MNIRLPKIDSATGRAIITTVQSSIGALITIGTGLWVAINGVPGCPDAVISFLQHNWIQITGSLGLTTGASSFIWNYFFRNSVKTY